MTLAMESEGDKKRVKTRITFEPIGQLTFDTFHSFSKTFYAVPNKYQSYIFHTHKLSLHEYVKRLIYPFKSFVQLNDNELNKNEDKQNTPRPL